MYNPIGTKVCCAIFQPLNYNSNFKRTRRVASLNVVTTLESCQQESRNLRSVT